MNDTYIGKCKRCGLKTDCIEDLCGECVDLPFSLKKKFEVGASAVTNPVFNSASLKAASSQLDKILTNEGDIFGGNIKDEYCNSLFNRSMK